MRPRLVDPLLSFGGGDETLAGNTLPQYPLRPGAVRNAENYIRRVSTSLKRNDKRADPVPAGGDIVRHFRNRTGDQIPPSPEDVGSHHGHSRHTGEPYELPPRQLSFHRDLFGSWSLPIIQGIRSQPLSAAYSYEVWVEYRRHYGARYCQRVSCYSWIPAFAGMTGGEAGMTEEVAGMTYGRSLSVTAALTRSPSYGSIIGCP